MFRRLAFALALVLLIAAREDAWHSAGAWGIDLSDRDPNTRAVDDLYASQNGGWLARTTLGPDRPNAAYWLIRHAFPFLW